MRIIGIDPGYAIVGFGVVDYDGSRFTPVEYGAIFTEANTPFHLRLKSIYDDMEFILDKYKPERFAIEKLFFTTNQKTGIVCTSKGHTSSFSCFKRAICF